MTSGPSQPDRNRTGNQDLNDCGGGRNPAVFRLRHWSARLEQYDGNTHMPVSWARRSGGLSPQTDPVPQSGPVTKGDM